MLPYNFPFLNQCRQSVEAQRTDDSSGGPVNSSSLPPLDRSTGSPDSLRSDTSSDSPDSVTDVLLSLQKQAAIITDVTKVETEKPAQSYIALISMALLSSKGNKMLLGEIYAFIMNKFPYYNNESKAWRNSIRHNLSINECFIKNGRADNGKGNYWSIHPACVEDFAKGDFRRRQARRRARKGIKDVNRNQFPATEYRSNIGYVPMTSSPFAYQLMTSSHIGSQPMTSSPVDSPPVTSSRIGSPPMTSSRIGSPPVTSSRIGSQPVTSSPVGYQPMTSSRIGSQPMTSSPVGYQPMTSSPVGNELSMSSAIGHPPTTSPAGLCPSLLPLGYHPYHVRARPQQTPYCPTSTSPSRTYVDYTSAQGTQSSGSSLPSYPLPAATSVGLGIW